MNLVNIDAIDLPDSWFQLLYAILECGREFTIDRGSYAGQKRLEFDYVTVRVRQPGLRDAAGMPLIPVMPEGCGVPAPVDHEYLASYAAYVMTAVKAPGEQYTYGERLHRADSGCGWNFSQVQHILATYKEHGQRNNQMILQIAQPSDLLLTDPPCLRHIDTRIQGGRLHFFIYFRSWDLWGGYPANLAGLSMLQEYMASELAIEPGEFICSSKGLHLYDYAVDLARVRCMKNRGN